jgi:hypothetical protein
MFSSNYLKRYASGMLALLFIASIFAMNLFAPTVQAATQATYYVSPTGSDSNDGSSPSTPFQTIGKAQSVVRTIDGNMTGNIIVNLRGGTYNLTSTLNFTNADSGTNGFNVIYQAYPGETPILSGGQQITGWTAVGNGQYKASIGSLNFRQLYVNGVRATRARWPKKGSNFQLISVNKTNQTLGINSSQISNWANFGQVEMVLESQWAESYLRLASYTVNGTTANVSLQNTEAATLFPRQFPILNAGSPFHFENAYEFLTEPGEFYVNTATQTLYYWPRAGESMATADVEAPAVETLVNIQGTSVSSPLKNMQFNGITFEYTTYMYPSNNGFVNQQGGLYNIISNDQWVARPPAGVYAAIADNLSFNSNTFLHMGSTALDLDHAVHNSSVLGNLISDISGNGIMVGKFISPKDNSVYNPPTSPAGEDVLEVSTGNTINDNYITQIGQDYYGTAGINAGYVNNTIINHNDISDGPWGGISLGWGWTTSANAESNNQISYNNIHNVMNELCDSGGIYHLSNDPGAVINGNYIHDIIRSPYACTSPVAGIYLDQGSANMTVSNNVLSNTANFIRQNGNGTGVTLTNNQTSGSSVIGAAGLESAYVNLKSKLNLAYGKTVSASSIFGPNDVATNAIDNNTATGWSPLGTDTAAWWQVDLGQPYVLSQFSLMTRQGIDQPGTRNNFEVRASNDPTFATYTVIGKQGNTGIPYQGSLTGHITSRTPFRYIRVAKTDGLYFYITEFSVTQGSGGVPKPIALSMTNWYKFDESSGTTAVDSSGSGSNGSLNGNATWVNGNSGNAVDLDGTNGYVSLPSGVVAGDNAITVTAWVYLDTVSNWSRIFDFGNGTNTYMFLTPMNGVNGNIRFGIKNDGSSEQDIDGTAALPTGGWHHVAVTMDGSTGILYVDGVQVGSNTNMKTIKPSDLGTTTQNWIGRSQFSADPYLNGRVDDFRIYNDALSPAFVLDVMNGQSVLPTAQLLFDETSGTTASDRSGNGWNGTLVNSPTWVAGHSGNAVDLNGTNQYVSLPSGVVSGNDAITIAAWVNLDAVSTWARIFDFGSGTNTYMFLTPKNGANSRVRFAIKNNGSSEQIIDGTAALPTGGWHHVAVTLNGSTGILYVDGVQVGSNTAMTIKPSDLGATSQNWIGRSQYTTDPYLNGRVDNFRIYSRALSAADIASLASGS